MKKTDQSVFLKNVHFFTQEDFFLLTDGGLSFWSDESLK